jgi:hypothetical protein
MTVHELVHRRSGGRCEAMVKVGRAWTRCFRSPVEVHHALTRARGGKILDAHGETAHLLALCNSHHRMAHEPGGHKSGLMIDGYVTTGADGSPVYEGSDRRLARYAVHLSGLHQEVPSGQPRS